MSNKPTVWTLALTCGALCCLAACDWSPFRGGAHSGAPARSASARSAALPAAKQEADMVTAVSAGKTELPVEVKFALRQRPELGQSIKLDVQVTPSAPLVRLIASFHAEDGLTLGDAAQLIVRDRPDPGVPIVRTLTLVPRQDGIFYVNATVLADSGSESIGRTFTIPVIAGAGTQ
jgi:hypothetical protein